MPIHRKNHWRERVALRELAERELEFWRDWLGMWLSPISAGSTVDGK